MDAQPLQTAAEIADKVYVALQSSILETITSPSAAETSLKELVQQLSSWLAELRDGIEIFTAFFGINLMHSTVCNYLKFHRIFHIIDCIRAN